METKHTTFAFFGTPEIAVHALEELKAFGYIPSLVVCNEDAPVGRKHELTPPPSKVWAEAHEVPVLQPTTLKNKEGLETLTREAWDFFVVVAYGKMMPEWLIKLPTYKTINAHPSLLPKLRGASPIRSALLSDLDAVGVTVIELDAELDHGPILMQMKVDLEKTIPGRVLDEDLARLCGGLLASVMEKLPKGEITPLPQNDEEASYCAKITKEMGELSIDPFSLPTGEKAEEALRKIHAFDGWPGTFFFYAGKRVKIVEASLLEENGTENLLINRVVPEGKKEMDFEAYLESIQSSR